MWEKIKALLTKLGIDVTAKESELKAAVENLEKESPGDIDLTKLAELLKNDKSGASNPAIEAMMKEFAVLKDQNKKLLDALGKEISDRENSTKASAEQAKAAHAKKVTDAVDKAFKEKRIVEADKPAWQARLEKDFDEWNKELEAKPVPKQFEKKAETPTGTPPAKSGNAILDAIAEQNQSAAIQTEIK